MGHGRTTTPTSSVSVRGAQAGEVVPRRRCCGRTTRLPSANCGQSAADLLAAALAPPRARGRCASCRSSARSRRVCSRRSEKPPGYSLPAAISCMRDVGRERADRALVAVGVPGVVQEQAGRAGVVLQDRRGLRGVERVARRDRERRLLDDERMVAEHDRRLVAVLGQLGPEPGELLGRERAGVAAVARLVVGVEPDAPAGPGARGGSRSARRPGRTGRGSSRCPATARPGTRRTGRRRGRGRGCRG